MSFNTRNSAVEPDIDQVLEFPLAKEAVPYLRLWAAVLHRGVRDYCEALDQGYEQDHPWLEWVLSDSEEVQSFNWMCDVIDLNPIVVRNLATLNYKHMLSAGQGKPKAKGAKNAVQ